MKAIIIREFYLIFRDKSNFLLALFSPLVYLILYSCSMSGMIKSVKLEGTDIPFLAFMLPGIILMTVLFNAMKYSQSIFNEHAFGMLIEIFSTPIKRKYYIAAKIFCIAAVATIQSIIIFIFGSLIFHLSFSAYSLIATVLVSFGCAIIFGAFFITICSLTSTISSFVSAINIITTLILFSGCIFYPLESIPKSLKFIALINPMTYATTLLRTILFFNLQSAKFYLCINFLFIVLFVSLSIWLFERKFRRI